MSPYRLPVYRPATLSADAYQAATRALPGRALAVLDPSDGVPSLAFAACLSHELRRLGRAVPVALASLQDVPAVHPSQRAQFGEQQALYAFSVQASEQAIAEQLALASDGLWVVVGQPALAFAPALAILVGADVPVLRWPDPLREARERISLALSGDGLAVAVAIARALAAPAAQ
jgi:hypothetical protein